MERLQRKAIIPPSPIAASGWSVDGRLRAMSHDLSGFAPLSPRQVLAAPEERMQILQHDLSPHFRQMAGRRPKGTRSEEEARALSAWGDGAPTTTSFRNFRTRLTALNLLLTGGGSRRRTRGIHTEPDRSGVAVDFPPVADAVPQMRWLWQQIDGPGEEAMPVIGRATVALVIVTNAHLFTDGNGRLSRTMFNHILHRGGMPSDVYVPVHEFASRSCGGFLIRVRQAELRGEWEPLMAFVLDMLEICVEMGRHPVRPGRTGMR